MSPPDSKDEEPHDPLDTLSEGRWAQVPELIRRDVEQHARGVCIGSDDSFFHFGGGMAVRNLCRERLSDDELAACCPVGGDWDNCYIGVLAAIAAMRQ